MSEEKHGYLNKMGKEIPIPKPKYSSTITTMSIPKTLADALKTIAENNEIPIRWTTLAKNILWGYARTHRARGNV